MRLFSFIVLLGFVGGLYAKQAAPLKANYQAQEVAPKAYVIHGPLGLPSPENQGFMNNPGFILTSEGVVVVDPGSSVQVGEMLLTHIARLTKDPVVAVFNTHVHGDHWLGNQAIVAAYPKVKIYAHPRLLERVEDGAGESWVELMMNLTKGATAGTKVVAARFAVDDGEQINIGESQFKILHPQPGKAHTDTDIMILVDKPSIIFLGDNAAAKRILRVDQGSISGNILALETALKTSAKVFVPGHGLTGDGKVARDYRDFLTTLYKGVETWFEEDLSDFEIKPKILDSLAGWKNWSGFEHELGGLVSQAYLEVEAAAF